MNWLEMSCFELCRSENETENALLEIFMLYKLLSERTCAALGWLSTTLLSTLAGRCRPALATPFVKGDFVSRGLLGSVIG